MNSKLTSENRPDARSARAEGVRERILSTASALFYNHGVRAVGVDLVVEKAGIAKTSLYRYFPTKDALVVAFLEREDIDFWSTWDAVAMAHKNDPHGELDAHMDWIGERLLRSGYRGCPQINVSAEFADADHVARGVARSHMHALRERLTALAKQLSAARPEELGAQLALLVNGAFVSSELLLAGSAKNILLSSARALVAAAIPAAAQKKR